MIISGVKTNVLDSEGGLRSWDSWGKDVEQLCDVKECDDGLLSEQRWESWEPWGKSDEQLCDGIGWGDSLVDGRRIALAGEDGKGEAGLGTIVGGGGGGRSLAVIDLVDGRHDLLGGEETGKEAVDEDWDVDNITLSAGGLVGVVLGGEDGDGPTEPPWSGGVDEGLDKTEGDWGSRLTAGIQQRSLEFWSRLLSFFKCFDVDILNKKL